MYVKIMELNYWTSSECKGCVWNEATQEWAVTVQRGSEVRRLCTHASRAQDVFACLSASVRVLRVRVRVRVRSIRVCLV